MKDFTSTSWGLTVVLAHVYAPNIEDPSFIRLLECKMSEIGYYISEFLNYFQ